MPANSPATSSPKYLLYSHYKALDQVQELGLDPRAPVPGALSALAGAR